MRRSWMIALVLVTLAGCATGPQLVLERPDGKSEIDSEIDANVCSGAAGNVSEYLFCMRRLGYKVSQR